MSSTVEAALQAIADGARAKDLESDVLEFKTQGRSIPDTLTDLAEAAACFANGRGGAVVVGVADRTGGVPAFVGCSLDHLSVQRRIFELADPPLVVSVEPIRRYGADLILITVPSSPDVHAIGGRSTERIAASCEPMSTGRIATVVAERRGEDWSEQDSGVDAKRVDPAALTLARQLLERSGSPRARRPGHRSDADLLRVLGVISPNGTLTNAGALLFSAPASGAEQISYVHRRTPAGALSGSEHLAGPLLVAVIRAFELVEARLDRTSVNLPGGQQLQVADLPETAIREAVINAVMHRDHTRVAAVQVEHTATRLSVASPGSFVRGVTVENVLTTTSRSRNASLCRAIRALGLAETAGTGVDRMYAEMVRIGHQPPHFAADRDQVRVTLLGGAPNAHLTRFTATLPEDEAADADTLLTVLTLLTRATVTATLMTPLLQKPEPEAAAVLDRLASDGVGLLERTRESARHRLPAYRLRAQALAALGPAVTYRRRTVDEYDRKIIDLLRETPEINARMVRLMLDLESSRVSRILGSLVERGILAKTSTADRGRNVTYGRGEQFPRRR